MSALHWVTVPMQTDEVDCQLQPRWFWQSCCVWTCVHGVRVPVQSWAPEDQLHPGVVHVAWVS